MWLVHYLSGIITGAALIMVWLSVIAKNFKKDNE